MNRESEYKVWTVSTFPTYTGPEFNLNHDDWPTIEDGDFFALRKEREKKQEKQRKDDLQKKVGDIPTFLRAAVMFNGNPNAAYQTSQTKSNFFNAISNGSLEKVKEMIKLYNINLTELMLDEKSQKLALHYALEENQVEIAKYFIDNWDSDFLLKTYNVNVKETTGKKNVLHRITEERYIELAKLFLSRLGIEERKKVILQETPMDISGQRPRSLSCFHLAAYMGSNELISLYLEQGVDVNSRNSKSDTALLWAARWNYTEVMETLLKLDADPNICNDKGSTALHWAVRYQHVDAVRILTTHKSISINSERKHGLILPIILSSALGCQNIVELLIDAGADANQEICGHERPIHQAAKEGHETVLKLLIDRGADKDKEDNFGNTALLLAIKNDHPLAVHTLIETGSDLCHKNRDGMDVWSYALRNESNKCLETLVYHIQKIINEKKNNCAKGIEALITSESPIFEAAAMNATKKLTALADMGIELETAGHDLNKLHHHAALHRRHEVIRQFAGRVDVNWKNKFNETPLHLACSIGCYETVKALLDFGAKVNIKNIQGETALHIAVSSQEMNSKTIKLLIGYMIKAHSWDSINEKDKKLRTAIHVAALKAKPEVIWECRFISCKVVDKEENTPFHLAVRSSQPEIFSKMLDIYEFHNRDADIDKQNKKGETPLYLVVLEGFKDQTERLIRYGADLRKQDCDGNSILHKLVEASVEDAENMEKHFEMMDLIIDKAATSNCIREEINKRYNSHLKKDQYRFLASMELLSKIKNNENLSVFDFACKIAAKEAVEKLLMLQDVTQFERDNQVYFDISHVTPRTNDSLESFCGRKNVESSTSCIEWLLKVEDSERAARLLDIPPLKVAEEVYSRMCSWVYFILMVLHILYMGLISYNADNIMKNKNNINYSACGDYISIPMNEPMGVIFYLVTPIEPIIIVLCCLLAMIRSKCIRSTREFLREIFSLKMVRHICMDYTPLVIMLFFSGLIITWMIFLSCGYMHLNVLSVSLCIGWLICFFFTRGFKGIHHFWRILIIMIFKDVLQFLFLYTFVLLSFSFAMHVLIDVKTHENETVFNTIFSTFNLMTGISDSETFKETLRTNDIFYFFYGAYMVLSTIIFMNLLIAMMNNSYQAIQMHESLSWRIDSMRLGFYIEKFIPFLTKLSSRGKIIKIKCLAQGDIKRWYVVFSVKKIRKYQRRREWERDERSQMILYKNK